MNNDVYDNVGKFGNKKILKENVDYIYIFYYLTKNDIIEVNLQKIINENLYIKNVMLDCEYGIHLTNTEDKNDNNILSKLTFSYNTIKIYVRECRRVCFEELIMPDSVKAIDKYFFFKYKYVKKIKLSNEIKIIDDGFLDSCSSLESIEFGDNVEEIGDYFMVKCKQLREIKMSKKLKKIGNYFLSNCDNIMNIEFGDDVEEIGDGFMEKCKRLQYMRIPKKIKIINDNFLNECINLTNITIPKKTIEIKDDFMTGCIKLQNININENNELRKIGNNFCGHKNKRRTQNDNKNENKNNDKKNKITSMNITNFDMHKLNKIIEIKDNFLNNNMGKLEEIILPETLVSVGSNFMNNNINLKKIYIPSSLKKVGGYFLSGCYNITNIQLDSNMDGSRIFGFNCTNNDVGTININNSFIDIKKDDIKFLIYNKSYLDINDFRMILEYDLCDIVELLFDDSIKKINDIDYYITGGKAINAFIKSKYMMKSFDYDIHIKNENEIEKFSIKLVNYLNEELSKEYRLITRYNIYKTLENKNLVDETIKEYYMDLKKPLFYLGTRNGFISIYIKIIFLQKYKNRSIVQKNKKDIKFNNLNMNKKYEELYTNNDIYNVYYMPVSDIQKDNFEGLLNGSIFNQYEMEKSIIKSNNGLKYSSLLLTTITTLDYSYKYNNFYKSFKLFNKVKVLILYSITYQKWLLNYLNEKYEQQILNGEYEYLKNKVKKVELLLQNKEDKDNLMDMFKDYVDNNNLYIYYKEKINETKIVNQSLANIIADMTQYLNPLDKHPYLLLNVKQNEIKESIYKKKLENVDENGNGKYLKKYNEIRVLKKYTGNLYLDLNTYLINSYITEIYDETQIENIKKMDELFENYNKIKLKTIMEQTNGQQQKGLKKFFDDRINDVFYCYSGQDLFGFFIEKDKQISVVNYSNLRKGDIIIIPSYMSVSYNMNSTFSKKYNLKIKINKNNKKWILIDDYSHFIEEKEVLLDKNSLLLFEGIIYENEKEYLEFTLCDTYEEGLHKQIKYEYTDNPLLNKDFIEALKFAYINYYKKPYTDHFRIRE